MRFKNYIPALFGASVGYFIIHPLIMIISHLMFENEFQHFHSALFEIFIIEGSKAFSLMMLPWALSLTVLGGGVGFYFQENKRRFKELQSARMRLEYLLTTGPGVIYTSKASGDYGANFISENVLHQIGYESHQFTENSTFWLNHIHPEDKDRILFDLPKLFEKGHHAHDYRFLCKTGDYIWMHDELKLIRDKAGKPLEIIGCWTDISELKLAQIKLEEAHDNLEIRIKERTSELENALDQIKTLKGIIPICSYCKKIHDDEGVWNQLEAYIHNHSEAEFSHGMCPECYKEQMEKLEQRKKLGLTNS